MDVTCWANGRGFGRFARELMSELVPLAPQHEFVCIGDEAAFSAFQVDHPNVRTLVVPQDASPTDAASADGYRSLKDIARLAHATASLRPDVFFSPSVYTFFPLRPRQRAVVTVHDAIADRFPELTLPSARARLFWRVKMRVAIRQATLILSVSDYAADQVADFHRVPRWKLRVALEAPAPVYGPVNPSASAVAAASVGIPEGAPYFTYVGGFSPHKRLDVVLRAHAAVIADGRAAPHLALIGRLDGDAFLTSRDALLALIDTLGTEMHVHWTGFLPDETVRALHAGAAASLLVSESEGFGLPAVEAAACGVPVVATTESPLPQLLEGGGLFVPPGDEAAVANALRAVLSDPEGAAAMGRRARERAGLLTWRRTAEATLDALEEAAAWGRSPVRV